MEIVKNKRTGLAVLIILHTVGLIGLQSSWSGLFASLTPVNLLLTGLVLFVQHEDWSPRFWLFFAGVYLGGWLIELVGIQSGLIFGNYAYGENMGPKLWGTPPIIGLNWLILIYAIGLFTHAWKGNLIGKAALGALLMVGLDVFIEPVAMRFDFWNWTNQLVPMQNYIAWWVISFVFLLGFHGLDFKKSANPLAVPVLTVQGIFFILNNLLL